MNEAFTYQYNFPHYQLKNPKILEVIDSCPISSGDITEYIKVQCMIGDYHKSLTTYVISLRHYPLVIGIPWLKRYDITIYFTKNDIQFSLPGYLPHCTIVTTILVKGLMLEQRNKIYTISTTIFWHIINNANKHYGNVEQFTLSLNEINTPLQEPKDDKPNIETIIPYEYYKYLKTFEKVNDNKIPPHHPYNDKIPLEDGFQPPFGLLYSLSCLELEELKRWLEENLSKGFIYTSSSPATMLILLVKKGHGLLYLVVDYQGINEGTIKNYYPLPLM
jgi:hypothetical protein